MNIPALALEEVSLALGRFALRAVSLTVAPGEILVLLGANGAGKSVILETIAGFHRPTRGRILINGEDVTAAPPERRRIGYVFQNFALFPHLTVAQNVRFALDASRARSAGSQPYGEARVAALLAKFGLSGLAARYPQDLSGGEKQRVALARALATDPSAFLFDEPFSALDSATRDTLRDELTDFVREAQVPAIYVTHDQFEAQALADRVAIVDDGRLVQVGLTEEVFAAPLNTRAARLVGVENLVAARVCEVAREAFWLSVAEHTLKLPVGEFSPVLGQSLVMAVRAEEISLMQQGGMAPPDCIALSGRVVRLVAQGPLFRVLCDCGFALTAYVTRARCKELQLAPGVVVDAHWANSALRLLADDRV